MRVLVVEDSRVIQLRLTRMLDAPDIELQVAGDGEAGVRQAVNWGPDLVLMDLRLPRMDGLTAIAGIMGQRPCPIVVLSGAIDAELRFEALRCGAVEALDKSAVLDPVSSKMDLVRLVRLYAKARVVRRGSASRPPRQALTDGLALGVSTPRPNPQAQPEIIAIGASTGGPPVIYELLDSLPADCGVPVLVSQHIEPGFAGAMCRWLSRTGWQVRLAETGVAPKAGEAWVTPGGHDLQVVEGRRLRLRPSNPDPSVASPSVDHLFRSVAQVYANAAAGVLLTGMGDDGARGLAMMRAAGAHTLTQDEGSCAVYGMPQAAMRLKAAVRQLPPAGIAADLRLRLRRR